MAAPVKEKLGITRTPAEIRQRPLDMDEKLGYKNQTTAVMVAQNPFE
jgi:hypothetical protein